MHPLTLWMVSVADLGERERERRLIRARRDSGTVQPESLTRDGRWAAAIHRWAMREGAAPVVAEMGPVLEPAPVCA